MRPCSLPAAAAFLAVAVGVGVAVAAAAAPLWPDPCILCPEYRSPNR